MSNRHQQRHLRHAGQITTPTKDHRSPKEIAATSNPDVRKRDSPHTGTDHIHVSLNGMISGIATKTTNKANAGDNKMSVEAITAACIEAIESGNESFAVVNTASTTTPSETNGTDGDTDNASSSLSKLFSKKKQPVGEDTGTARKESETTTDAPSDSGMPKRRDSFLDIFKKRMSSLNLSEEEYGKSNEKTEFDTDSDSDSNDEEHDGDADINLKVKKNGGGDDSVGLDIFGGDSRFAIADDGWVSFSNKAA